MNRSSYIQVTVTETEKRKIEGAAKAAGLSVASYIRTIALKAATKGS